LGIFVEVDGNVHKDTIASTEVWKVFQKLALLAQDNLAKHSLAINAKGTMEGARQKFGKGGKIFLPWCEKFFAVAGRIFCSGARNFLPWCGGFGGVGSVKKI
jgi:hypothetical protein